LGGRFCCQASAKLIKTVKTTKLTRRRVPQPEQHHIFTGCSENSSETKQMGRHRLIKYHKRNDCLVNTQQKQHDKEV